MSPVLISLVIAALIQEEDDDGLSLFLPPTSTSSAQSESDPMITLPLQLPSEAPPLPRNPRAFAVRLLQRYSFVLGDTPSRFFGLKSSAQARAALRETTRQKDIGLLCINDDLPEDASDRDFRRTDELLRAWFRDRWPYIMERERDDNLAVPVHEQNEVVY